MTITPKQSAREIREERILTAARSLFFAKGYKGTSVQQIAVRAGYSKRTLYLDFLSKDELFMTLCAEGGEVLLETLDSCDFDSLSVESGLIAVIDNFISFCRDRNEYFKMIFIEANPDIIAHCSAGLRERLASLERQCMAVIVRIAERAIAEGLIPPIDPWEAAGIIVGSSTGIILLSMGGSQTIFSRATLESLVKKAIMTLWIGLRSVDSLPSYQKTGEVL